MRLICTTSRIVAFAFVCALLVGCGANHNPNAVPVYDYKTMGHVAPTPYVAAYQPVYPVYAPRAPVSAVQSTPLQAKNYTKPPKPAQKPVYMGLKTTQIAQKPAQKAPKIVKSRFMRPTNGKIISAFGVKPGGYYNDGINIDAKLGATVQAAAPGTVIFAGAGPVEFGKVIMVRHADGYLSVYGHLANIKVSEGQSVAKGALIGTVGASGNVTTPQLHFEIRLGTRPLNPEKFI